MRLRICTVLLLAVGVIGCSANEKTAKASATVMRKAYLTAKLAAQPTTINVDYMPGPEQKAQTKEINLRLTVTNPTKFNYKAEWKDAGVARFWITDSLSVIWLDANLSAQPITTIEIAPGQSKTYEAKASFDARTIKRGTKSLTAHGIFLPAELTATQKITVTETH